MALLNASDPDGPSDLAVTNAPARNALQSAHPAPLPSRLEIDRLTTVVAVVLKAGSDLLVEVSLRNVDHLEPHDGRSAVMSSAFGPN